MGSYFLENRDLLPNTVTSANWTCVGISAHESAVKGGEIVRTARLYIGSNLAAERVMALAWLPFPQTCASRSSHARLFSSYSLYRCTHAKNSTARPRASNCGDKKNDYKVNTMPRKTQLGIAMFMALLVQCSPPSGPSEVTEENKEIVRRFIEVVNDQDFDLLDELMVSDFVRHSQPTPDVQVRSLEDFKVYLRQDAATTPDSRVTTRFLVGEDDLVAFYGTYAGTQAAQWGPFPPSGKRMEVEMGGIFRLEDGKIAEMWVTWDNLSALRQLGHFPPPNQDLQ